MTNQTYPSRSDGITIAKGIGEWTFSEQHDVDDFTDTVITLDLDVVFYPDGFEGYSDEPFVLVFHDDDIAVEPEAKVPTLEKAKDYATDFEDNVGGELESIAKDRRDAMIEHEEDCRVERIIESREDSYCD